jgi:hypothetical protein
MLWFVKLDFAKFRQRNDGILGFMAATPWTCHMKSLNLLDYKDEEILVDKEAMR